jgi:hypothetical protein
LNFALFSQWENYEEPHFPQDVYHHVFCFPSEHDLTIIVLVRGLGVEAQQNDMSEVMIFSMQFSFEEFGQNN